MVPPAPAPGTLAAVMKNVLLKFAGLFVERVPVDDQGRPLPPAPTGAQQPNPASAPQQPGPAAPHVAPSAVGPGAVSPGVAPVAGQAIAVALRAWVPQEYAAHLAPHGVHVIAAGGSVTSEQARGWGASVLIVSAECLGQDLHLLQQPQLPTVFITPQPAMIPDTPGLVQVQEPLRASDVAHAAREAVTAWSRAHG